MQKVKLFFPGIWLQNIKKKNELFFWNKFFSNFWSILQAWKPFLLLNVSCELNLGIEFYPKGSFLPEGCNGNLSKYFLFFSLLCCIKLLIWIPCFSFLCKGPLILSHFCLVHLKRMLDACYLIISLFCSKSRKVWSCHGIGQVWYWWKYNGQSLIFCFNWTFLVFCLLIFYCLYFTFYFSVKNAFDFGVSQHLF